MENYKQQLINNVIENVLSKYEIRPSTNLTKKEKRKVREIVEKIQTEVAYFFENHDVKISLKDLQNKNRIKEERNKTVTASIKKLVQSQNDLNQVKMFI